MTEVRDWKTLWAKTAERLERRTGDSIATWNRRIRARGFRDPAALGAWLEKQGVTGYAHTLLVMERFGYPDFFTSSADELVDAQYEDRGALRPIYDAIVRYVGELGPVAIQTRKTYVSLVTERRTFARVRPTTRQRVDVALRLPEGAPTEGLHPSRMHMSMAVELRLGGKEDFDRTARRWIRAAYEANR